MLSFDIVLVSLLLDPSHHVLSEDHPSVFALDLPADELHEFRCSMTWKTEKIMTQIAGGIFGHGTLENGKVRLLIMVLCFRCTRI